MTHRRVVRLLLTIVCVALSLLSGGASNRVAVPVRAQSADVLLAGSPGEEFVGPFPSWIDVTAPPYNAVGDGVADDRAALQLALDAAGSTPEAPRVVVYLPAGRYRITGTLTWSRHLGVSFLGEDPSTTTIVWDGPPPPTGPGTAVMAVMMEVDGVAFSRWGRITWDGAGRADVGVAHRYKHVPVFSSSGMEHADEVFQDMQIGILGGSQADGYGDNDDTVTIVRSRFLRCSTAGVALDSYNALNWWIWDSEFVDNKWGVTTQAPVSRSEPARGAGNFLVYRSVFRHSSTADLSFTDNYYFTFRWNTSIGSARFLDVGNSANAAATTLQGNRILDPTDPAGVAVEFEDFGPLVLLDNQFRTSGGPAVRMAGALGKRHGRLLSTGNRFTVSPAIDLGNGRGRIWNDQVVPPGAIDGTIPPPPPTAPRRNRPVFEVPRDASGAVIQAAIDQAAARSGERPVVHLPAGKYAIAAPLVVPAGADVQLVGDGMMNSLLEWTGASGGTMIDLPGPSRATIREITLDGVDGGADGIHVSTGDAPTSRVFVDQPYCQGAHEHCVRVEGLTATSVEIRDSYFNNIGRSNVRVTGSGAWRTEDVRIFGGSGGAGWLTEMTPDRLLYEVDGGGRLLVEDAWFEGWNSRVARLTDSGTFTYWAGTWAPYVVSPVAPMFEVQGFDGRATVFGVLLDFCSACTQPPDPGRHIVIGRMLPGTDILLYGLVGTYFSDYVERTLPFSPGRFAFLDSYDYIYDRPPTERVAILPRTNAPADTAWLEQMLAQMRTATPSRMSDPAAGVTDVRIHRVEARSIHTGLHVRQ